MDSMAISQFKATCLAALERVRKTGRPLRVTRFGKPIAEIRPPTPAPATRNWLGARRATGKILGDIVGPTGDLVTWKARE
jgi:antitoxin (DNA-binding transcriptional repressor) of toxin-antitoxin stability system